MALRSSPLWRPTYRRLLSLPLPRAARKPSISRATFNADSSRRTARAAMAARSKRPACGSIIARAHSAVAIQARIRRSPQRGQRTGAAHYFGRRRRTDAAAEGRPEIGRRSNRPGETLDRPGRRLAGRRHGREVVSKHWAYQSGRAIEAAPQVGGQRLGPLADRRVYPGRLEKEHLAPSPEASRETLLRRLYLDLLGLLPTPAEREAFLADQRPRCV